MRLAIRADGDADIGYGHLVRTGALAGAFLDAGHSVTYLTRTPEAVSDACPSDVETVTLPEDSSMEREAVLAHLEESDVNILVTDSYEVDTSYQETLRPAVPLLAVICDDDRHPLCCDVAINGNAHAEQMDYEWVGAEPLRLFGLQYLLLREEFQQFANRKAPWRDPPERAILLMGGSDVNNATPDAIRAFDGFDLEVDVIVGPGFRNLDDIESAVKDVSATVRTVQDPPDLAERMFEADFAVSATGSTVYELIATETPTIGIPQAENQRPVAKCLEAKGALLVPGSSGPNRLQVSVRRIVEDPDLRRRLRKRDMVDGDGAERVRKRLLDLLESYDSYR